MLSPWSQLQLLVVCAGAVGTPLLGLIILLTCAGPNSRVGKIAMPVLTLSFAAVAAAARALEPPVFLWLPPALLAAVCGAGWLSRSPRLWRGAVALTNWLMHPRLQAAVLLAAGPVLAALFVRSADEAFPTVDQSPELDLRDLRLEPADTERAFSDAGRPVPLYLVAEGTPIDPLVSAQETAILQRPGLRERVLRVAAADDHYNCHGWLFAAGRYWIKGEDVPRLLTDNGYQLVSKPEEGDLAIYRDPRGHIVHSGVVRLVGCPILIESKWGRLGRFLHPPEISCYGGTCSYYRSPRLGHRLHGIGATPHLLASYSVPVPAGG